MLEVGQVSPVCVCSPSSHYVVKPELGQCSEALFLIKGALLWPLKHSIALPSVIDVYEVEHPCHICPRSV